MIKNSTKSLFALLLGVAAMSASAQYYSTFEDVNLGNTGVVNGKDGNTTIVSGELKYRTEYNNTYDYWSGGFAASNKVDVTTAGYTNIYSTIAGRGANNSSKFAVGQPYGIIVTNGKQLTSIQITNTTFAALSMKNGDSFAKKFGGATGKDADFFRLIISAYLGGDEKDQKVTFYLADFRNDTDSLDYIMKDWSLVDLSSLGKADSIQFTMESSDVGQYGINTPTFFCIDNLNLAQCTCDGIAELYTKELSVYPNPVVDQLFVDQKFTGKKATIRSITGAVVTEAIINTNGVDLSALNAGVYVITIADKQSLYTTRFIKQ